MVVLEHKAVSGKKDGDQKSWVEKVIELNRMCCSIMEVEKVIDTMIKNGCHEGQHLRTQGCRETYIWNVGVNENRMRAVGVSLLRLACSGMFGCFKCTKINVLSTGREIPQTI